MRGYDLHWERFGGWCRELGYPDLRPLPRGGDGGAATFGALVSARGGGRRRTAPPELRLRLRPAQPLMREAPVIVGTPGDPRVRPRWKGPDLELLLALRAQAVAAGAGELLVCDEEGRLVEGAFTSLLWWEDGALWTTPGERTLPGVTRALLLAIAQARGVRLGVRSPLSGRAARVRDLARQRGARHLRRDGVGRRRGRAGAACRALAGRARPGRAPARRAVTLSARARAGARAPR